MTARRFLSYQGSDVAPIARCGDKAVLVYLDWHGQPTTHTADAWAHELRGLGWHLAAIKQLLSLLPEIPSSLAGSVSPAAAGAAPSPTPKRSAGGFLHAHYALPPED